MRKEKKPAKIPVKRVMTAKVRVPHETVVVRSRGQKGTKKDVIQDSGHCGHIPGVVNLDEKVKW